MNTQRVEGHTPTLKACPFCGANSAHVTGTPLESWPYQVWCGGCDARIDECGTEAIAIEVWNTRASIERLEKVNEALAKALGEAIKWIENASEDAWGYANDDHAKWPLRDELASKLRTALAKEPA